MAEHSKQMNCSWLATKWRYSAEEDISYQTLHLDVHNLSTWTDTNKCEQRLPTSFAIGCMNTDVPTACESGNGAIHLVLLSRITLWNNPVLIYVLTPGCCNVNRTQIHSAPEPWPPNVTSDLLPPNPYCSSSNTTHQYNTMIWYCCTNYIHQCFVVSK